MNKQLVKNSIVFIIFFCISSIVGKETQAQFRAISYPFNTHYFLHKYPINPAYIGEEGEPNVGLAYKKANGFFETAGNRAFGYVHGKSEAMKGGGFGVLYNYMDANAQGIKHTQMSLGATATYNQNLMDLVDVKIGVTTSFLRYRNNRQPNTGGPTNPQNPQATLERFAKINLDAGVLLALADFELGVAMHHNNQPQFEFYTTGGGLNSFNREIFITASYDFSINDDIGIAPHLIIQQNSHEKDLLVQTTLLADYQDMIFGGFSYIVDFDTRQNPNTNYTTREFHKIRLTAAGKLAEQFLVAASLDFATQENYKMQFETSLAYYFNRDDY